MEWYTVTINSRKDESIMLGVFLCFIMLQLVLREGLNRAEETRRADRKPAFSSVPQAAGRKAPCRDKAC